MAEEIIPEVEYELMQETELRFEVEGYEPVQLQVLDGTAELFGSELVKGKLYKFYSGKKVAVFCWEKCRLKLIGKPEVAYRARETPMVMYINIHAALEQLRDQAVSQDSRGPRIMITGATDVGKSTICKMLCSWATRSKRTPLFVDLDVGQSDLSIPGTIGANVIEEPVNVEDGYNLTAPLIFHFGYKSPGSNTELYKLLCSRMAEFVMLRCENVQRSNTSGIIINTCGWVRNGGYHCVVHAAGAFEVDVIVVLDQERLYSELLRDMPDFVKVILLPKSGGVVERSKKVREIKRDKQIHEYFYGTKHQAFYPHTFEISWDSVKFFKIGGPEVTEGMLPVGVTLADNKTKLVSIEPSQNLIYHVCSLSTATNEDEIVQSNVAGFIVITQINIKKKTAAILSPTPGPLPYPFLIVMEEIKYNDELPTHSNK